MTNFRRAWPLSLLLLMTPLDSAADQCLQRSGQNVQPMVELYTSEGCSSCPPADSWLSQARRDTTVNWLAFHVDYWDSLGWPDRYADQRYSGRQRTRVAATGAHTVYTPQVMSGAETRVDWRSASGLRKTLDTQRAQTAPVWIEMRYDAGKRSLEVLAARAAGAARAEIGDATLWLAALESGLTTQVRAGENARRELRHDVVVRQLYGPFPLAAADAPITQRITLGASAADKPAHAVAWVEDARHVPLQSLALLQDRCAKADLILR